MSDDFDSFEEASPSSINLGKAERVATLLAGTALVANTFRRRSPMAFVGAATGVALLIRGITGHCPVYSQLGISTAGPEDHEDGTIPYGHGIRVERAVTILKPAKELYAFWRNFDNLPRFMDHVRSITKLDEKRSHWVVEGPAGRTVEWDAELINDIEGELIAWKTVAGADVDHAGSVHFREVPNGRGTEVRVLLRYDPPGGKVGGFVARLFGEEPSMQVASDLRRLKRILEIGEEPTVEGQSSGRDEDEQD
jgi:uncharacterized membrane protein